MKSVHIVVGIALERTPMQTFEDSKDLAKQKDLQELFYKNSNFNLSSEAEVSAAGEQLTRNSLTDGNGKAVDVQSTASLSIKNINSFLSYMP